MNESYIMDENIDRKQKMINKQLQFIISTNRDIILIDFSYDIIQVFINISPSMLSRFIVSCLRQSNIFKTRLDHLSYSQFSNFAYEKKQTNPFHFKIIQISSNNEFFNFFKQNKELFDSHSFSVAAKTLGRLIFQNKNYVKFNNEEFSNLKVFLESLKAVNVSELNTPQFMNLLHLSKTMKSREINSREIRSYIQFLKVQASKVLPKIIDEANELSQLSYFYNQISNLDIKQSSNIAQKIVKILQKQKQESKVNSLTSNLIIQMLAGMKNKQQINISQKKLLGQITRKVNQQLIQKLSFYDLVRIAGYLNQVINNSGQKSNYYNTPPIFNRILTNIDQLDQKSIMFILSGQLTNNQTYKNIYSIIFEKIFDEIQPSGRSSFSQQFTMKIFSAISSKIKLSKTKQLNQKKFMAFIKQSLQKNPKYIATYVKTMIQNKFFSRQHLQKLVEIFQITTVQKDFTIPLSLLFSISSKNINLKTLFKIDQEKIKSLKYQNLLMYGQIMKNQQRYNKNDQTYNQTLQNLRASLSQFIDTPQKFGQFVFKIVDKSLLTTLNSAFSKVFSQKQYWKIFQQEQGSKIFRNAFLITSIFGTYPQNISKKYSTFKKANIQDIVYLLKIPNNMIDNNKIAISNILWVVSDKMNLVTQKTQHISLLGNFLSTNFSQIKQPNFFQVGKSSFWNILKKVIQMNKSQIFLKINRVIKLILNSNFKNSLGYQSLIKLLLQNQQPLNKFNKIHYNLINQALKLGLINKETAQKIPKQLVDKLQNKNKRLINILLNSKDYNPFQAEEFNVSNLSLYVASMNPENIKILQLEKGKIFKYIQSNLKPYEALQCVINFRIGYPKIGRQIFSKLMENLNTKIKNYQYMNYLGICHTLKKNSQLSNLKQVQNYFKNSLQFFSKQYYIKTLNIQSHLQLISRANQSKIINNQYMKKVLANYKESFSYHFKQLILLYCRIGYSFDHEELQQLKKQDFFSKSSFNKNLKIFLLLENVISDPKTILKSIITKSKAEKQIEIPLIQFEYLRAKFPQQTQGWQPKTVTNEKIVKNLSQIEERESKNLVNFKITIQKLTGQVLAQKKHSNITYYKIRNICLVILSNYKYQQENKLLLKLLKQSSDDKNHQFIALNSKSSVSSLLRYIDKESTSFLTEEQKKSLNHEKKVQKQNQQQQQEEHDHLP